jgi:hypothetical protein
MIHRLATLMVGFLATGALLAGAANADFHAGSSAQLGQLNS